MERATSNVERIMNAGQIDVPANLYHGAGRAWAAINEEGGVVALIYMGGAPFIGLEQIGRKRLTQAAMRALADARERAFLQYRAEARKKLSRLGRVVSGMCSATKFYPKEVEMAAKRASGVQPEARRMQGEHRASNIEIGNVGE